MSWFGFINDNFLTHKYVGFHLETFGCHQVWGYFFMPFTESILHPDIVYITKPKHNLGRRERDTSGRRNERQFQKPHIDSKNSWGKTVRAHLKCWHYSSKSISSTMWLNQSSELHFSKPPLLYFRNAFKLRSVSCGLSRVAKNQS